MAEMDGLKAYEFKKQQLLSELTSNPNLTPELKKKTASNLFRYITKQNKKAKRINIKNFDNIIQIDLLNNTLEVEGLAPYEKIVKFTLQHQLLPTVAPELKHITIGGAIVGIGIESTSFKYGFVHDGLLEAEVLLPNGRIILCTPDNEFSDLFYALPNSYGTLGYILRAKIKLYPVKSVVHMKVEKYSDLKLFIDAMYEATQNSDIGFVEGLTFNVNEHYLMLSYFIDPRNKLDDIYHESIFYKLVQTKKDIYLSTEDYIFRYDPDWFWNVPETFFYNLLRRFLPKRWRNSGFYKKYTDYKHKVMLKLGWHYSTSNGEENLIQDWEVPWDKGYDLLEFALRNIDINGKPWAVVPIKPLHHATLYPLMPNQLYFNLGCYCSSKRVEIDSEAFHNTKIMDNYCFSLHGLKMLYSSTFLTPSEFAKVYNGSMYASLKEKYDPKHLKSTLYEKIAYLES